MSQVSKNSSLTNNNPINFNIHLDTILSILCVGNNTFRIPVIKYSHQNLGLDDAPAFSCRGFGSILLLVVSKEDPLFHSVLTAFPGFTTRLLHSLQSSRKFRRHG